MQPYISTYWNNNRIEFDLLLNERLKSSTDMLIFMTRMFKMQKDQFETIPTMVFKGLLKLDNDECRHHLIP